MVHKNHQLLQALIDQLHSAEWCFWVCEKKHLVVRSFTVTVIGQSAISLHPSDYIHAKHDCHITPLTIKSKSFDNGAKWNDCPLEVCNPRPLSVTR